MSLKSALRVSLILLACTIAFPVFAQQKMKDKDAKDAKKEEAPVKKDKEKIMIFNGDLFKVQLYGFVKLDAVYNTADVQHETHPFLVINQKYMVPYAASITALPTGNPTDSSRLYLPLSKSASQRDGSFVMDARTTRLGFAISGPEALYGKTSALIEFDFWGQMPNSSTANRQGMIRMRHAYGKLDWSKDIWSGWLLIGQWWSLNTPTSNATADMLTFIPFGKAGLVFMREPQAILGQKVGIEPFNVSIEVAAARVQSGDDSGVSTNLYPGPRNSQIDERGPGEASKKPGLRAKVAIASIPVKDLMTINFAVAGHYQWERHALSYTPALNVLQTYGYITAAQNTAYAALFGQKFSREVQSYDIGAFGNIQIHMVNIVGAFFMGSNMDNFLCGLDQGVAESATGNRLIGVKTHGGYGQVQLDFRKFAIPVKLGAAYGGEWKNNAVYINTGQVLWNRAMVGTVHVFLNNYLWIGAEVARHETKYKRVLGSAENWRYQGSMKFSF